MRNPFRALNPTAFDKGEKLTRRVSELQRVATTGVSSDGEALTALGNALGNEVAAMIARYPHTSIDEILHLVWKDVREQAYTAAGVAPDNAKGLSGEGFNELATRIIDAAATNTTRNDAICATAKALGVLVSLTAQRNGCSQDELMKFVQQSVARFAQDEPTKMA